MSLAEIIAAKNKAKASTGTAAPAHAPAGTPLAGGSRLAQIKSALAQAKTGTNRNKLPLGTGWFLLKNGAFKVTDTTKSQLTSFSFLCIHALEDAQGLQPTSANYTGPKKGEEYEIAMFHNGKFLNVEMAKNLQALQACMGWSAEYVKDLQATEEGLQIIMELLKGLLCVSLEGVPTNEPCALANQVVIELSTKESIKDEKGKDGQPSFDEKGNKKTVAHVNTYWNKRISLETLLTMLPEAEIVKAFGSEEAFASAADVETSMPAAIEALLARK